MKTSFTFISLAFCVFLASCNTNPTKKTQGITNPQDYNKYLHPKENKNLAFAKEELNFWSNKMEKQPSQYPYLGKIAGANSVLFASLGDINYLKAAQQKLTLLNEKINYSSAGSLRSLARNYISQHKFREALVLLKKAEKNGQNLETTQKMLFDVHFELGNYKKAENYLSKVKDFKDFGYLIRIAKWNDHLGDLKTAIHFLEEATRKAELAKNETLKLWCYTNLADYYGHNNQVQQAYNYYLKSLALDPNNSYAKKGIAWIAYSYEKKPKEALRIIDAILAQHQSPAYYLIKADIAEFMKNKQEKEKNIKTYLSLVSNKKYGDMYNQYSVKLFLNKLHRNDDANKLIAREMHNRPTPHSYSLLGWSYYKEKQYSKALELMKKHVEGKTFEPEALYHLAEIYKANGYLKEALALKEELLQHNAYELGPIKTNAISNI